VCFQHAASSQTRSSHSLPSSFLKWWPFLSTFKVETARTYFGAVEKRNRDLFLRGGHKLLARIGARVTLNLKFLGAGRRKSIFNNLTVVPQSSSYSSQRLSYSSRSICNPLDRHVRQRGRW
jgi:hypothetical protein